MPDSEAIDALLRIRRQLLKDGLSAEASRSLMCASEHLGRAKVDGDAAHIIRVCVRAIAQDLNLSGASYTNIELIAAQAGVTSAFVESETERQGTYPPSLVAALMRAFARIELEPLRRLVDDLIDEAVVRFGLPDVLLADNVEFCLALVTAEVRRKLSAAEIPIPEGNGLDWIVVELYVPAAFGLCGDILAEFIGTKEAE